MQSNTIADRGQGMRKYKDVIQKNKLLVKVECNGCGREIMLDTKEEYFHGENIWGYFSNQDGRKDSFDLCQECYEKMIQEFIIKIEK